MEIKFKVKYLVITFVVIAIGILFYCTTGRNDGSLNVYSTPDNFKEGVWIQKYPGNYTSFKFETPEKLRLISDPFALDELVAPDVVTFSHMDLDHSDTSMIKGSYKKIQKAGNFNIKGITITGISGKHQSGRLVEQNIENVIYVYDMDGIKIAQFASEGALPSEDMFKKIGQVDVLILQVFSGGGKMTMEECLTSVKRTGAKIVIPAHGDQSLNATFAESLGALPENHDDGQLIVKKSELGMIKAPKLVVLDN